MDPLQSEVLFQEGIANFSFSLYGKVLKDGNECLSPFSITAALLLLMLGTDGTTKRQMEESVFRDEIPMNIHDNYERLDEELSNRTQNGVTLSIANRLYPSNAFTTLDTYKANALRYYGSESESLDYINQSELSRVTINNWISAQTNNKINDMLKPGSLKPNTLMVLVNAIYFKGLWKTPFDPKSTRKMNFEVGPSNQKQVDMMFGKFKALSGENLNLDCKVLQLPYEGDKLSMVFILPQSSNGLPQLESRLSFINFKNLLNGLEEQETIIRIPKFIIEEEYDLGPILTGLGIVEIFDNKVANFSNMISKQSNQHAHVSEAIHKVFMEVNEEGSEAAAATAIKIVLTSALIGKQPFVFRADHPFMFVLLDNESNTILFVGRYTGPKVTGP